MTILHIAHIKDSPFNGVCIAVPQHVQAHQKTEKVGFINISNVKIDKICNQFDYCKHFCIDSLPAPFNRPDIVVFHETYRVQYLKIYPQLINRNIPYVIIPHGELSSEAQQKKRAKKVIANILFFNRFINNAVALQCLSSREFNSTHFGTNKIVETNGINIPINKKTAFNKQKTNFIYVGRLESHVKGLDLLLDAIKIKQEFFRKNNCKLSIYGPDYQGRFQNVSNMIFERGLNDIVSLNREIMGDEKERVLLSSDIFIQTSRHEGMPLGILEALAYGIPCIVTTGTSLSNFVSENNCGWTTSCNANDIADALEKAVVEKNLHYEKSIFARKAIIDFFSWDIIKEQTLEAYKKLIL